MTESVVINLTDSHGERVTIMSTTTDGGVYIHADGKDHWLTVETLVSVAKLPDQTTYARNVRRGET
jgi:hypothetical protein